MKAPVKRIKRFTCLLGCLLLISGYLRADENVYTGFFSDKALGGYDAVSFFDLQKPRKGLKKFSVDYNGAVWLFISEAHRQKFKLTPEKYAPQYGGFCAWAVADKAARAPGDPRYWKIVEGKLYLNYSESVQQDWLQDVEGHISQADRNWPTM